MDDGDWNIYSGDDTRDRLVRTAIAKVGAGQPVVIINLLRFREWTDYAGLTHAATSPIVKEGKALISGEECYMTRYIPTYHDVCKEWFKNDHGNSQKILYLGKDMVPLLNQGRVPAEQGQEDYWHAVIVLRYPSFEKAMEFQKSDEYWQANFHRAAALEDNVAWVSRPIEMAES